MADDDDFAPVGVPRFSVSRVLADAFETLIRIAPRLLAIVGILGVPVMVWLILGGRNQLLQFATAANIEDRGQPIDAAAWVLSVLLFLVGIGIHAAVTDAAFEDMLGEAGDLLQSLGRALVVSPVLIGVALFVAVLFGISLFTIGFAGALVARVIHWSFGLMLAVGGVAGIIALAVRWWVLVPVIVVESANPLACFKRSTELTDGNRWKICALLLIAAPVFGAVAIAVINIILSALFMTFNTVATVMIYGHLRAIKEGSSPNALAAVFD
jgi:hypothetical protein